MILSVRLIVKKDRLRLMVCGGRIAALGGGVDGMERRVVGIEGVLLAGKAGHDEGRGQWTARYSSLLLGCGLRGSLGLGGEWGHDVVCSTHGIQWVSRCSM